MPKLDKNTAAAVAEAEVGYALLPDGEYEMELVKVSDVDKDGNPRQWADGGAYWIWQLAIPKDAEKYGNRRMSVFTSLPSENDNGGQLNATFAAFGATTATDTDDLVERAARCIAVIGSRKSKREVDSKGDALDENVVKYLKPLPGPGQKSSAGAKKTGGPNADMFA